MVNPNMQHYRPAIKRIVLRCTECRKNFVSFGTDEDALVIAAEHFGQRMRKELSVVCLGCWEDIKRRMYGEAL